VYIFLWAYKLGLVIVTYCVVLVDVEFKVNAAGLCAQNSKLDTVKKR
jgi:hypothetical protein